MTFRVTKKRFGFALFVILTIVVGPKLATMVLDDVGLPIPTFQATSA